MTTKKRPNGVLGAVHDEKIDDQIAEIVAMPNAELDKAIEAEGGDPKGIRARGAAFAKELMERRTRLAWHAATEKRVDAHRGNAISSRRKELLPRTELLARIEAARQTPRLSGPIAMMFRKKSAEASTDAELQALLEEIELLSKAD